MIENMKKQFAQLLYDIGFLSSAYVKDKNANRLSSKYPSYSYIKFL